MAEGDNRSLAYSYHTYVFPFLWDTELEGKLGECWKSRGAEWGDYQARQYFYPAAYDALYRAGEALQGEYVYRHSGKLAYHIRLKDGKPSYKLDISPDGIRLKVYSTGIALLLLECENWEPGQSDLASVKDINDYGRRITMPIAKAVTKEMCAAELRIEDEDSQAVLAACHFGEAESKIDPRQPTSEYDFQLIRQLLHTRRAIRPALDDRMFVACTIQDGGNAKRMIDAVGSPSLETEKSLYELLFVDHSGGCTCQDASMRRQLLDEHIYRRWLDSGTLYGIEAQSLIQLTDDPKICPEYLVDNFRGLYTQMCCLALVQKASLVRFQSRCTVLAKKVKARGLKALRKELSIFEGQLYLAEISSQEQPIEMYDRLIHSLRLQQNMDNVRAQMDGLYNVISAQQSEKLSILEFLVALIGLFLTVFQLIPALISRFF